MLAYLDTMQGLVPVKVTRYVGTVRARLENGGSVHWGDDFFAFRVTARRGAWPKGHEGETAARMLVPRDAVKGRIILRTLARVPVTL